MPSDLKNGTLWTPPTFTDDGSQEGNASYLSAGGTHGMNGILGEIAAVQSYAANRGHGIANVRDFGATGDGTTDDRAAIQSAIDSGHRIIYLPPGMYRINDTLTLGTGGGNGKQLVGVNTGGINGGEFSCLVWGGVNHRGTAGKAMLDVDYGFCGGVHGIGFKNDGKTYYHMHVYNSQAENWVEDSHHSRLLFWGDSHACVRFTKCHHQILSDSFCDNGSSDGYFLEAENANGCRVINCTTFFRRGAAFRFFGDAVSDHADNSIQDCWVWLSGGCAHPIMIDELGTTPAVLLENQRAFRITSNTFAANGGGVWLDGCSGVEICGNVFDFHQLDTIVVKDSSGVNVTGNTFTSAEHGMDDYGHYTLKTSGTTSRVLFSGNVDNDAYSSGVLLQGGTTHSVVDNYVHDGVSKTVTNQGGVTNVVGRVVG